MAKADVNVDFRFKYVSSHEGKRHEVTTRQELEARIVQDIMTCNLRREPVQRDVWLDAFKVRISDTENCGDLAFAMDQVKHYLDDEVPHIEVRWIKGPGGVPGEVAELVMKYLEAEGETFCVQERRIVENA